MNEIRIALYEKNYESSWDVFVQKAKNKHFFFYRNYMEYHQDRFKDFSLMAFDAKNRIMALLPASKTDDMLVSHGGLTFGGFVIGEKMSVTDMLSVFAETKKFLAEHGIKKVLYKCIPYIYSQYPADEDRYALFINNAKLIRRDVSSAIYLPARYKYQKGRKWMVNRGKKNGIQVKETKNFQSFIDLENKVLRKFHNTKAVHTGSELELLADRFPDNIHLYVGELDGELLAGTIVFENGKIAHTQYMANSEKGRELGALDCVIDYLVTNRYSDYEYLDFGMSNENQGRFLNEGLASQKEGFGGRAVVYDFYEWNIK